MTTGIILGRSGMALFTSIEGVTLFEGRFGPLGHQVSIAEPQNTKNCGIILGQEEPEFRITV